ncbi:general odorant-binding protein 69a-like [Papilio machaon]|uniref:general odorant-binding protein 69a-like n=1 Tax=Papilio machaon TaxID=76193 RepID=UPI001E663D53|nr:general odorant-binding protein 69a-like [Papilio machaon]
MIYTILLIIYLLAANASPVLVKMPSQMAEKVNVVGSQCIKETGAPIDSLTNSFPWNLPETETNEKFLFCLCKNLNLINDQGDFNYNRTMKIFANSDKKEAIEKTYYKCNTLKGKDRYDTTYKSVDCFFKNAPVSLSL